MFVVLNVVVGIVTTRFERVIASVRSELPHVSKPSGVRLRIRKRTSRLVVVVCIPADQLEIFSREEREGRAWNFHELNPSCCSTGGWYLAGKWRANRFLCFFADRLT